MYWAMETIMVEAAADGDASPGKPWRRCVRLRRRGATPHRERQRTDMSNVAVVLGERLARYGFGDGHPFGPDRHGVFVREFEARGLDKRVRVLEPRTASEEELRAFHSPAYLEFVRERSESGQGFLDAGDTPAFRGVYEAAACVVGATLSAVEAIMRGECRRAFVPIAGLHHAGRERAAGFCVFNDCGVAIELLKRQGLKRVGYVDIDAHHGDGVFYAFEEDPAVVFADLHEDGRYLYPGTGARQESGRGAAEGTKLNLPLPPGADDEVFAQVWPQGARGAGLGAHQQVRGRLSRQALLWRLRVRGRGRAARDRPGEEALRRRLCQRAAALRLPGERRGLPRAGAARGSDPRHEPRPRRTPDARRQGQLLREAVPRRAVRHPPRDRRDRLRAGTAARRAAPAEDDRRRLFRLLAGHRLGALRNNRPRRRRVFRGGHGARRGAGGGRPLPEPAPARRRRDHHHS